MGLYTVAVPGAQAHLKGIGGSLKKFRFRVQDLKIVCGVDCGGLAGKLEEQAEGVESSGVAASERKEGRHPCVKMLE